MLTAIAYREFISKNSVLRGGFRPVTSLRHQEGREVFREGPKFFELCPIFLNDVQHIFPGGAKNFLGGLGSPGYEPGWVINDEVYTAINCIEVNSHQV